MKKIAPLITINSRRKRSFIATLTLFSLLLFLLNFVRYPFKVVETSSARQVDTSILTDTFVPFIENVGQIDDKIRFYADLMDGTAFIEQDGTMTYRFRTSASKSHVIKEQLLNTSPLLPEGRDPSNIAVSSFIGSRENWKQQIPNFKGIDMGQPYKGISLHLHANSGSVEKIFTVAPGARPSTIALRVDGAEKLSTNNAGEMIIKNGDSSLTMSAPVAYQKTPSGKTPIDVNYRLINATDYGFKVGTYDPHLPLIIDPILGSTYLGGSAVDGTNEVAVAIDSNGKIFVAGETQSSNFPTTSGVYDETYNTGFNDAVISRFSSDLTTLEASTFIGGTQSDQANALAIDSSDNVYVAGGTTSGDYPTTGGAYDETFNFNGDVFVSKLSNDLTTLSSSTFIGGGSLDTAYDIGITPTSPEKVLITGRTQSSGFPTTGGAFDTTFGGSQDAFVSKFDIDLTTLEASTFVGGDTSTGGPNTERGMEVAGDAAGDIYVAGYTNENDLPTTGGAYDGTFNGVDGFFGKFDSALSPTGAVLSYFGGTGSDFIEDLEITPAGVYMSGLTTSSDFPTTAGAYSETISGTDGFISRFSTDLSTLQVSTFVGGDGFEGIRAIDVDSSGNVYGIGESDSTDIPSFGCSSLTPSGLDALAMGFSSDLSTLNSTALIGGSGTEAPQDIVIDGSDNIIIAGYTTSTDFPTTTGAYNETSNGSTDMFVTKLSNTLDAQGSNQFCGTQIISSSTLTFQDIPDTFNFGTINSGSAQDLFNNENPPGANQPAADDLLQIFDDRNSGGFTVTLDPDGLFDDENGVETIPLDNLYIVTSLDETDPGNNAGVTYGAGFSGDTNVSAPLYVDVDTDDLTDTATYTGLAPGSQFGGAPLTILDGTLSSAQGRDGTMSTFANFYLHIDPTQPDGSYSLVLTYTLTDSTT